MLFIYFVEMKQFILIITPATIEYKSCAPESYIRLFIYVHVCLCMYVCMKLIYVLKDPPNKLNKKT